MTVTVLTAALPERADMLAEAIASVRAQTYSDVEHLYAIDEDRQGAAPVLNRLLEEARGDRVMVLDDDDLLDPGHLDTVLGHTDGCDVVYTLPRVEGGSFTQYHEPFDARKLAAGHNCVSHNALMPTALVRQVGGWRNVQWFDLDLFCRLEQAGAEFRQIREETWTYRLHGSNWSQGTLADGGEVGFQ